jgi:hypothetical protein
MAKKEFVRTFGDSTKNLNATALSNNLSIHIINDYIMTLLFAYLYTDTLRNLGDF